MVAPLLLSAIFAITAFTLCAKRQVIDYFESITVINTATAEEAFDSQCEDGVRSDDHRTHGALAVRTTRRAHGARCDDDRENGALAVAIAANST